MKTRILTWIIALTLTGVCAGQQADQKEGEVIPELHGFKSVTIRKVEPDGLRILHEYGAAKIPVEKLTDAQRTQYGLTMEGAAQYRNQLAENAAASYTRQQEAASARSQAPRPAAEAPKFITADQVKIMWVKRLRVPRSLDPNYSKIMQSYRDFIADIKAGNRDLDAQETAATYNKSLAIKTGNSELANTFEAELVRISQAKSAAEALAQQEAQARRQRADFIRLEAELRSINRNLSNIDTTVRGW